MITITTDIPQEQYKELSKIIEKKQNLWNLSDEEEAKVSEILWDLIHTTKEVQSYGK